MNPIRLRIVVLADDRQVTSDLAFDPATPVAAVVRQVILDHDLAGTADDWTLTFHGESLDPGLWVGELVRRSGGPAAAEVLVGLVLVRRDALPSQGVPTAPPATATRGGPRAPVTVGAPVGAAIPARPPARSAAPAAPKFEDSFDEDLDGDAPEGSPARRKRRMVTRRATVRYYSRMNPERMFPLLVVLSAEEIERVVKKAVAQAESAGFKVKEGSQLVVEPVLPGCDCYPPAETISADPQPVTATFWVVPRVLGKVSGARVVLRQNGRVLSEVPLDVKVSKQTAAVVLGLLGLFAPYLAMGLKAAKLDFESQQQDGFPVYRMAGSWCAENVRPEWLGFGLLGLAVLFYFWARPKRRDVFWDVTPRTVTA